MTLFNTEFFTNCRISELLVIHFFSKKFPRHKIRVNNNHNSVLQIACVRIIPIAPQSNEASAFIDFY